MQAIFLSDAELAASQHTSITDTDYTGTDSCTKVHSAP